MFHTVATSAVVLSLFLSLGNEGWGLNIGGATGQNGTFVVNSGPSTIFVFPPASTPSTPSTPAAGTITGTMVRPLINTPSTFGMTTTSSLNIVQTNGTTIVNSGPSNIFVFPPGSTPSTPSTPAAGTITGTMVPPLINTPSTFGMTTTSSLNIVQPTIGGLQPSIGSPLPSIGQPTFFLNTGTFNPSLNNQNAVDIVAGGVPAGANSVILASGVSVPTANTGTLSLALTTSTLAPDPPAGHLVNPEPASLVLLATGLVGLAALRRLRRKS